MKSLESPFEIIRLRPDSVDYYPASVSIPSILQQQNFVPHPKVSISLGQSRIGGPVVDLPAGMEYPPDLYFACQLDLAAISPLDPTGLLPKNGQLLFFTDLEKGKVVHTISANANLVRTIKEHEECFWNGKLITNFSTETETMSERFDPSSIEDEDDTGWGYFAGSEKSKIFGIYTHCQLQQEEIEEIAFSSKTLLLQIGEDFTEEGVLSVLIEREDLRNLIFDNCEFSWGQS
ncbi:DUF1963 domain-containing protein [Hymenobacter psychrotolerans]|uniref:DUF1963 domain-containing protein n=1 Tax=Hymenobacter psychrotolerans DSM 18569 TaxID=1121959 RepID=A0A1M7F9N9_9BACT|nr:DUF1963 domain-containing protein [Hymenobacter psychrotolerans]SHM00794.1 protein of unknown function [Hymenobacter psychrotolerans DSM 18569]